MNSEEHQHTVAIGTHILSFLKYVNDLEVSNDIMLKDSLSIYILCYDLKLDYRCIFIY